MNSTTYSTNWNDTVDWGLSPHDTIWSYSLSSSNSNGVQSPSLRYSETPLNPGNLSISDDRVHLPQETPKRENSLYRPRQILGEIYNFSALKPIWEENNTNDSLKQELVQQQPAVNTTEYEEMPLSSVYDQKSENYLYQRRQNNTDLARRQWDIEVLNENHNHNGHHRLSDDNTVGRPIVKTEHLQTYDVKALRSAIFTSTPTIQPESAITPDFGRLYSSNDGYKVCTFCKKNGERPSVYTTHAVRAKIGKTYIVTCPILRQYICPECNGTGDNSHTISYCPVRKQRGDTIPSTTMSLKKTKIKSNGSRRF